MDMEIVTDGLRFPEGPVWMRDGSIIVTEVAAGVITRVWPDGRKEQVADCGGGPNGIAVGPDGWLYVCNNGGMICHTENGITSTTGAPLPGYKGGWIDRIHPDSGKVERLYEAVDGRRLAAPNDIVFDYDGGFWFSDFGKHVGHTLENGGIYHARPDGSTIRRALDGFCVNGIGLSPDGKTVYGACTYQMLLMAFDIVGPGEFAPPEGFIPGRPVAQFAPFQFQDSLAVDAEGNICVATCVAKPGIAAVNPVTGRFVDHPFPDVLTTNICFGGADMQDAWITMSTTGRLAKVRWNKPGLRLAHYA